MDTIRQKLENNDYIFSDTLSEFIVNLIKERNFECYVSEILFDPTKHSEFNFGDGLITINLDEIWYGTKGKENIRTYNEEKLIDAKDRKNHSCSDPNKVNIYNIQSIYHELRHVYQLDKLIKLYLNDGKFNNWYDALLYKNSLLAVFDSDLGNSFYIKYHNYFFDEYDANINAYIDTLKLLNGFELQNLKKVIEYYNRLIAMNIFMLYKDIDYEKKDSTPSLNMLKLYKHLYNIIGYKYKDEFFSLDDLKEVCKPTEQFERLCLGFSLSNKVLTHIYNVSKGKDKTLNLFDDIKNIRL